MVLNGYYGKNWLSYLTEKMGIQVVEGDRADELWKGLRKYQRGKEGCIPLEEEEVSDLVFHSYGQPVVARDWLSLQE